MRDFPSACSVVVRRFVRGTATGTLVEVALEPGEPVHDAAVRGLLETTGVA